MVAQQSEYIKNTLKWQMACYVNYILIKKEMNSLNAPKITHI